MALIAGRSISFWAIQLPGWILALYLVYAQGIPAFDYDAGVAMGTQEPAGQITEIGTAFFWGFAFGDVATYIPLLMIGLVGHYMAKPWAKIPLAAALGITVYWPVVALGSISAARNVEGWNLPKENEYWIVLPIILLWASWGLWHLVRTSNHVTHSGEK